jgi:hypothetical protein
MLLLPTLFLLKMPNLFLLKKPGMRRFFGCYVGCNFKLESISSSILIVQYSFLATKSDSFSVFDKVTGLYFPKDAKPFA